MFRVLSQITLFYNRDIIILYVQLARRFYIQDLNGAPVNSLNETFYTPALGSISAIHHVNVSG